MDHHDVGPASKPPASEASLAHVDICVGLLERRRRTGRRLGNGLCGSGLHDEPPRPAACAAIHKTSPSKSLASRTFSRWTRPPRARASAAATAAGGIYETG